MVRPGFHSVTPRIMVDDPERLIAFLAEVFGAVDESQPGAPAELRIGDSLVMVSHAEARGRASAFLYIYVDDADDAHARAVAAGATTVEAPLDTPYGDRRAMVTDPWDNTYQLAHVL